MIWVFLGVGLWICLSVPIALVVGALMRPRRAIADAPEAPRELAWIPTPRTPAADSSGRAPARSA